MREGENGERLEPIEEVTIDVDDEYSGAVIEKMTGVRKGELAEMKQAGVGKNADHCPCAIARLDRLSRRVPDRYPRHWRVEPGVPRMGPP